MTSTGTKVLSSTPKTQRVIDRRRRQWFTERISLDADSLLAMFEKLQLRPVVQYDFEAIYTIWDFLDGVLYLLCPNPLVSDCFYQ